ncbi:MAG: ligand-binding protein SH3 [Rhodospirillaceae bacterium TMED8]|nr:ligand-binding protein SH3 [Magnetovibrio sp.]OUT49622.1 MAG: ligand-binding protein SH3 [Rhodospirillaceae bacterium TMED8]|tara:strand:+ start:2444 stop:2776 length:333 start_codon:yes stop_codon:yes gene_type:complete
MAWVWLAAAIITEVIGTIALKASNGFSHVNASLTVIFAYAASFILLGLSLKEIELGVAYAIWAGVGTALITVVGISFYNEPFSALKIGSISLIIVGVVGLNLSGPFSVSR